MVQGVSRTVKSFPDIQEISCYYEIQIFITIITKSWHQSLSPMCDVMSVTSSFIHSVVSSVAVSDNRKAH